jgi:GTP-binding protein LepA
VVDGQLKKGDRIKLMATASEYEVLDLWSRTPKDVPVRELGRGEVAMLYCGIKDIHSVKVGDTITHAKDGATEQLPGFQEVQPMVFCGIFPVESPDYPQLRDALEKLTLNDAAMHWEPETSGALGFGFRCGFLGLLHMEVVQERLEREFDCDLVTTAPSVVYRVHKTDGELLELSNPGLLPAAGDIERITEPIIKGTIHIPPEFIGPVVKLCEERRGIQQNMTFLSKNRVVLEYELPLAEVIFDFFDKLKSNTRGYGSFDYEFIEFRADTLVKVDVLLHGEKVDALSVITHKDKAYEKGKLLVARLRKLIPRQQFDIPVQAAVGSRIIARETVKALRKDVTAKCYGGDISRKRKLLEKQKKGKKRMKQIGSVEVPQTAFHAVLSTDSD